MILRISTSQMTTSEVMVVLLASGQVPSIVVNWGCAMMLIRVKRHDDECNDEITTRNL